jgi:biotin carboxylase
MPQPRILLVAATTGYQTRSFAAAAARAGVEAILATDRCHVLEDPWRDRAIPVRFEDAERSAGALAEVRDIDGIVAVADRPTHIAALAAERRGIPWHPPAAVLACRDKHRARELFEAAGLPVPRNFLVPVGEDPAEAAQRATYPCVLKPLGLSASRGVIRADTPAQFMDAFLRIGRILRQPEIAKEPSSASIQVEAFIPGREFAVEGLMTRGRLRVLAIFDKPDPLDGPFFEETIYVTPSREPQAIQKAIESATARAASALALWHGPIHAEMRVNERGVWMLEIAARPIGGLCARVLRFEGGMGLEELIVLHAVGRAPERLEPMAAASGVMMIPVPRAGIFESVEGVGQAVAVAGVDEVVITAKPGERLVPLPEGASYTGFIFASVARGVSGVNADAVEQSLRRAHGRLHFRVLPALDVLPPEV